jgi:hypothetical protein
MLVQQSKASKTPTSQVIRPPPIPYEYGTSHDLLVGFFYTHAGRLQNWWYFISHPSNGWRLIFLKIKRPMTPRYRLFYVTDTAIFRKHFP